MPLEYYIVVNEHQEGPFSKDNLRSNRISPDTLVWRAGLPDWVRASELAELADILTADAEMQGAPEQSAPDCGWYGMIGGTRMGPSTVDALISMGLTPETPVWHAGLQDWTPASSQAEIMQALNAARSQNPFGQRTYGDRPDFSSNPQYGPNPQYGQNPQYGRNPYSGNAFGQKNQEGAYPNFSDNPQYGQGNYGQNSYGQNNYGSNPYGRTPGNTGIHTNWLPWAITATVVGFLFSCIGAIFGIIAIVQANKANGFYAAGFDTQGDMANSSAKTMTIIGFVLAGIGFIATTTIFSNNLLFSSLY